MWDEMYPGISQICGGRLGSSRRSRAGRSSHVAALWEEVAPRLPSHAGLATVVGTAHLEWGSSVSELWEEGCWSGFDNELPGALFHVPELWVRVMGAPWGGQRSKRRWLPGVNLLTRRTRSLDPVISGSTQLCLSPGTFLARFGRSGVLLPYSCQV